jgi:hypothetical protein
MTLTSDECRRKKSAATVMQRRGSVATKILNSVAPLLHGCKNNQSMKAIKMPKLVQFKHFQDYIWRRRPDSNWGMELLQSSALPLGYGAGGVTTTE